MKQPTNHEIMEKLISIEESIAAYINPATSYSVDKKAQILAKSIASGSREQIKAAQRLVNGA